MMHKEFDLPELEELEIPHSIQEEWNWSRQYDMMYWEHYEECNLQVQHVGHALHQMNPLLNEAIKALEHYMEWEFHQGLDIRTRTHQEPSGSTDEHLHVASHTMAYCHIQDFT